MATSSLLTYEWDKRKESSNIKDHGVSFHEASTVFLDVFSMTFFVSHTDRGAVTRIISAREATKKERDGYEKASR
jgi:uncharacterized DUF497 family protein